MKRKENWQISFFNCIETNYNKSFEWGKWDCCKFSDACIKAMTGESLIPKEWQWETKIGAMKVIKNYGGTLSKSIENAAKNKNLKKIKKPFIQCGDLIIFKEDSELVGMYDGMSILAPSDDGLETKSPELALRGWRIDG